MNFTDTVTIDYTNHRGERAMRRIVPIRIFISSTEWHPETQWLLSAWDADRRADRAFAMANIHSWGSKIDESLAHQLRLSMERNARMTSRLFKFTSALIGTDRADLVDRLHQILRDEEPTWPPAR